MIEISLNDFVLTLLTGAGLLVIVALLVSGWLKRKSERQSLKRRVICRLCLHAYEDRQEEDISICPVCHARNERGNEA